jgi:ABC-type nitrate/sulfonate/bicarbonate transport system permease component
MMGAAAFDRTAGVRRIGSWTSQLGRLRILAGPVVLLVAWELLALSRLLGRYALPTPAAVWSTAWRDGLYGPDALATVWEATRGWIIGNLAALCLALACGTSARLRQPTLRLAVASYCVPTIAIGPILVLLASLDTTKVALAAMSVFFTSLVAFVLGLDSADPRHLDLVHAYGGGRWQALRKVRLRAAMPAAFSGLALAVPAAMLGAMIGDYLGGHRGLGVVMLQAEASVHTARVWAVGITATAIAGAGFALMSGAGRRLAGAATIGNLEIATHDTGRRDRSLLGSLARRGLVLLLTLAALAALWWAAIAVFDLNPYFAKTPADVIGGLKLAYGGTTTGSALLAGTGRTLLDAALGYVVGTVVAVALAGLVTSSASARSFVMPTVLALRSVPLVAMTPLLALVFGDGSMLIAVLAGIVVFVPSVVTIAAGLAAIPAPSVDLFTAYGASRTATLLKLRVPYAVPALFAAARVALPGAVLGAVLAEWLLTDSGLGHLMAVSVIDSNFVLLWGALAIATAVSVILYQVMAEGEELALDRMRR